MDNTHKEAQGYDISEYDLVYIIFKSNVDFRNYHQDVTKFDKSKGKYYVKGKIVRHKVHNTVGQVAYSYPKERTLALVAESDIIAYNKLTSEVKKQEMLRTVHFGDIEFITLAFDSLDWIK